MQTTNAETNILKSLTACQKEVHARGFANQVVFDPKKESLHILSMSVPYGGELKLLGVRFDASLTMRSTVEELVQQAGWKLKTLIRTRRYYTDAELVTLYKAHMLSYVEYRTPAIYHSTKDILGKLDRVQS